MNSKQNPYEDIINLPHHTSRRHAPMSRHDRAAQFAPFAALTGHGSVLSETARLTDEPIELGEDAQAILDMKQSVITAALPHRPMVTVTYFREDDYKYGGAYLTLTGRVKEIDSTDRVMIMENGQRIHIACIIELESELFSGLF